MKKYTIPLTLLILSIQVELAHALDVLVFSKTAAYRHSAAINAGNTLFSTMATIHGWNIEFTENSADFTNQKLNKYDAIIWNNVSGDVLNADQQQAFKSYINAGGGYVGIHNAANAETNWPWYVDLLGGATFLNHAIGSNQIQSVSITVENSTDPITSHFESSFIRSDEWYNFTSAPKPDVDRLLFIDESTLAGPNMGGNHPITWKHDYDGGRAFYTGFGHTESSFGESDVVIMLTEAIKWVSSKNTTILEEFNGSTEPGQWVIQAPYNGSFPFNTTKHALELTGVANGSPNQQLVREGIAIDPSLPYTIETKFKILNYGGVKSFAVNFLQDNQPASQRLNAWSLNLDLNGPLIKFMGFVNGNFDAIGIRRAPWAIQNQEYIYKIEVNRRLGGEFSPKWVTATISKPNGEVMDTFEVDYSKFRWQPNLNEPVKFGLNSHFASWIASDLKVYYTGRTPSTKDSTDEEEPQLLGYWPFDGHADDVSGNQHHTTEFNNPNYYSAHLNSGLEANGAYASVNSDPFDSAKFTLMAWIKPDNVSGSYRVIMEKDKLKSDWYGLYQIGNKIHARWSLSGYTTATDITLEADVFTHVAATFDGTSARIYINGVLKHSALGSPSKPSSTKGELRFGVSGVGTEAFLGLIDEAKIFNTALNQSKIQLEMESSAPIEDKTPDPITTPSEISVTGVKVSPVFSSLNIGDKLILKAVVTPSTATNKNVIWKSDNPSIVHINASGILTGVATGTTSIKVATVDSDYVDTISVSVTKPIPTVIVNPVITLASVAYQIDSLKVLSWDQIRENTTRSIANTRLAQTKNYFTTASISITHGKNTSGSRYLKLSSSSIKKFISTLENAITKGKIQEAEVIDLINEGFSITANIDFILNGQHVEISAPTPVLTPAPVPTPTPVVNPNVSINSISYQIATLKIASWDRIKDNAVRKTANARLAQAKNYFNIATANIKRRKATIGKKYLKISTSSIKKYISTLKTGINKSKLTETAALLLLNEANSINANINYLIEQE